MSFFYFEIAEILRNALLISSILSNSEVWYGVTQTDIDQLEQVDEMWLRIFSFAPETSQKIYCIWKWD